LGADRESTDAVRRWEKRVVQLQILIERADGLSCEDFNHALRLGLSEAAHREGIESLVLHLVDDEAKSVDAGQFANAASFDALIGCGFGGGAADGPEEHAAIEAVLAPARALGHCHLYRVDYRVMKAHGGFVVGERTPGVVMASTVRRAARLSAVDFDRHWKERHAPLALKHHVGMHDYRQLSTRAVLTDGSPPWEGIALMGFPTASDFKTGLFDSPEGMKIIMADTERFLALDQGETAIMGEYWLRAALV
jgi:uncharacterized protein (TIGR02118 family)